MIEHIEEKLYISEFYEYLQYTKNILILNQETTQQYTRKELPFKKRRIIHIPPKR